MAVRRALSYPDALKILGAGDSRIVAIADRLAGAAASTVSVATLGALDLFGVRDELVACGRDLVTGLRDRLAGLNRLDRTERLIAAHAVIVVTSFYEAYAEVLAQETGLDLAAAELTAADQVALAAGTPLADRYRDLVKILAGNPPPMPSPTEPFEQTVRVLRAEFQMMSVALSNFLVKLAPFAGSTLGWRAVAEQAVSGYVATYRRLAAEVPEFAVWASMTDAQATRTAVRAVGEEILVKLAGLDTGLAGIGELLAGITGSAAVDRRRTDLATRYRNRLNQAILDFEEPPGDIVLPALGDAYINPAGRFGTADAHARLGGKDWWADRPLVADIQGPLVGYLTSSAATEAPLVILGQPGAGKSVLTRVLAARLPPEDFLPIRVELRSLPADASVQRQIEEAILLEIGQRVEWPELVRSAPDALPVVMFDGFDELLQATGLNRADYLEEIQGFQRREAELGRPVAAIVTTRTVVAERARCPAGALALRLEPFDRTKVERWLSTWNAANEASLAVRGLATLTVDAVMAQGELASEPLLILMLAIYDAAANGLQRDGGSLGQAELYERLFTHFARREVRKHHPGLPPDDENQEIERELRRLAAAAVSMFNRGGQVITEAELNSDLPLLRPGDADARSDRPVAAGLNRPLTPAQRVAGRFFFIHASKAHRDTGPPELGLEFLHATFGEYLVARAIVGSIVELTEQAAFWRTRPEPPPLDAGPLYAMTSFATIAERAQVVTYCRGLLARLPAQSRTACRTLLIELLRRAEEPHPTWTLTAYEPVWRPAATRLAAYTANLVVLIVAAGGTVAVDELFAGPDPDRAWNRMALLWRGQLSGDWEGIRNALRVTRSVADRHQFHVGERDASPYRLYDVSGISHGARLGVPGGDPVPLEDAEISPRQHFAARQLHDAALLGGLWPIRSLVSCLAPVYRFLPAENEFQVRLVLELLLMPPMPETRERRTELYVACLKLCPESGDLLLRQLILDRSLLDPADVVTILSAVRQPTAPAFHRAAELAAASGFDGVAELLRRWLAGEEYGQQAATKEAIRAAFAANGLGEKIDAYLGP